MLPENSEERRSEASPCLPFYLSCVLCTWYWKGETDTLRCAVQIWQEGKWGDFIAPDTLQIGFAGLVAIHRSSLFSPPHTVLQLSFFVLHLLFPLSFLLSPFFPFYLHYFPFSSRPQYENHKKSIYAVSANFSNHLNNPPIVNPFPCQKM